jgi:hypothetical protein
MVIEKNLFQDLMLNHAGFGSQLCVILANRLIKLLQNLPTDSGKKELQGSLRYFDLATVIQTLITSGQSGKMALNTQGQTLGELVFQSGNIFQAKFSHRTGDEAIHQLFQVQLDAEFLFTSTNTPGDEGPDPNITVPAMALLMDSVRFQDELQVLREILPSFSTVLERAESTLQWSEDEDRTVADELWERLQNPTSINELLEGSSCCHYHAVQTLHHLIETEQLMPVLQ